MRKIRKKVILATVLASLSLSGCKLELGDWGKKDNAQIDDYYQGLDVKEMGFFDDTMVEGIELFNPVEGEYRTFVVNKTDCFTLDSKDYEKSEYFWKDAIDIANSFLSEKTVRNSDVIITTNTYEGVGDRNIKYLENRAYFKYWEDDHEKSCVCIKEIFLLEDTQKNEIYYIYSAGYLNDTCSLWLWTINQNGIEFFNTSTISIINKFTIPRGFYNKQDLAELERSYSSEEKTNSLSSR